MTPVQRIYTGNLITGNLINGLGDRFNCRGRKNTCDEERIA